MDLLAQCSILVWGCCKEILLWKWNLTFSFLFFFSFHIFASFCVFSERACAWIKLVMLNFFTFLKKGFFCCWGGKFNLTLIWTYVDPAKFYIYCFNFCLSLSFCLFFLFWRRKCLDYLDIVKKKKKIFLYMTFSVMKSLN